MEVTKFTKAITINGEEANVIFNGVDFTQDALIEIQKASSVTFRNCRIYDLNLEGDKKHFITTADGTSVKISFTDCYTGTILNSGDEAFSLIDTNAILVSGSTFSRNYMSDKSFPGHFIDIANVAENAVIHVDGNTFSDDKNGVSISTGTTCTVTVDENVTLKENLEDPYDATVVVKPGADTTSMSGVTINVRGNRTPDTHPIISVAGESGSALTEENLPVATVDGVKYTFPEASETIIPVALIGKTKYATLADAFAAAVSGDTITIVADCEIDNSAVNTVKTEPVLVVPTGVTVDGMNHTVKAAASWVSGSNHLMGSKSGNVLVKNLTLEGSTATKSGFVCWNSNATMENVTIKNCGNCAVQVSGGRLTATNVNTSGNVWGAINVDKSSTVKSIPHVTFNSGTLSEKAQIWTEQVNEDYVTAPSLKAYIGYGTSLKGYKYYTNHVSQLGVLIGNGTVYETVQDALTNSNNETLKLLTDLDTGFTIPCGKVMTIDGQNHTIKAGLTCTAKGTENITLTLKNVTIDGQGTAKYGIISQNQSDTEQMECNLYLSNVTIKNFTAKAIYATNFKTLSTANCHVQDCATGIMDDPNTKGDYAVDLNLCAVQNTVVTLANTTFSGDLGDKAAVKITQRGGASDAGASDIPKNVGEAKIKSVTLDSCSFTGSTTEVDYQIGTNNKTPDGDGLNTCGNYQLTLRNNSGMVVRSAYLEGEPTTTLAAGVTVVKSATGDLPTA